MSTSDASDQATVSLGSEPESGRAALAPRLRTWLRTRQLIESRGDVAAPEHIDQLLTELVGSALGERLLRARERLLQALPRQCSDPELTSHQAGAALAAYDQALEHLPPIDRDLLILHIEFGLAASDLAEHANLPLVQIDDRLQAAALRLAGLMP